MLSQLSMRYRHRDGAILCIGGAQSMIALPASPPAHAPCACPPLLPQFAMKRQVVGIWKCKACNKTQAGGAYVLK